MSEKKETAAKRGRAPNPDAKNGIAPPKEGTSSAAVWDACEQLKETEAGAVPSAVIAALAADKLTINSSTVKTQIARWRQFNGMVKAK